MIKTTIRKDKPGKDLKFPILMANKDQSKIIIALGFWNGGQNYRGICIASCEQDQVGNDAYWNKNAFEPFEGEIILKNEKSNSK